VLERSRHRSTAITCNANAKVYTAGPFSPEFSLFSLGWEGSHDAGSGRPGRLAKPDCALPPTSRHGARVRRAGRAHGLRKAGAATAAENGATAHQLMSIFGWLTMAEAERYTREPERKRMAGDAMNLVVRRR
jgi:hypothetical protein